MNKTTFFGIVILAAGFLCIGYGVSKSHYEKQIKSLNLECRTVYDDLGAMEDRYLSLKKKYDGEGNHIPDSAVNLLVISQFAKITKEEQKYLDKYFYVK
ncbi:MAG TPA: hypothetical protein VGZ90_13590 [Puia sp.]|jgi:hypothetical protein|nr:hypothetical protein [Puia sp.]